MRSPLAAFLIGYGLGIVLGATALSYFAARRLRDEWAKVLTAAERNVENAKLNEQRARELLVLVEDEQPRLQ